MCMTNAFALKKLICEAPRSCNEQADGAQNFRVPVYELIENIENDMTEGTAVIDRGLPALRAVIAVSPRTIFAGSSDISWRGYKKILSTSTAQKLTPSRLGP